MSTLSRFGIFTLFTLAMLAYGCSDSDRDEDDTTQAAFDNALAENFYNDLFRQVHRTLMLDTTLSGADTTIPYEVCIDTIEKPAFLFYPFTLVLDYGNDDTACVDGRIRKGRIRATLSGPYGAPGTVLQIRPDSFYLNEWNINGQLDMVFEASAGNTVAASRTIRNGRITDNDLGYYKTDVFFDAEQRVEMIAGMDTNLVEGDVFAVTGTATGRNSRGAFFDATIVQPERFEITCIYESAGTHQVLVDNLAPRLVSLGTCDREVVVSINGGNKEIQLPR